MALLRKYLVIDLTTKPVDHLTALPSELQHMIFELLLPTHQPDLAFEDSTPSKKLKTNSNRHPLDYLSAVCHSLRREVRSFARHWLKAHAAVANWRELRDPIKYAEWQSRHDWLRGTPGLLHWLDKRCVFCGRGSVRRAILKNGFRCCKECDKVQWPDKITKTDAKKEFNLQDHQLLPRQHPSNAAKLIAKHPGLIRPQYGTYVSNGVTTTMFLRSEVRKFAEMIHGGDLDEHMRRKHEKTEQIRRKRKEGEEQRQAKKRLIEAAQVRAAEEARAESERVWAEENTPFNLAAQHRHSREAAIKMVEKLVRETGVDPANLVRKKALPLAVAMDVPEFVELD